MQAAIAPSVRLRLIALPSEHGGWGLLGAPILAGLIIAPTWVGVMIALAGIALFLTRQPFRLALTDIRKGKRYPRTIWAIRFALGYFASGIVALIVAANVSRNSFLEPLLVLAALGAVQFSYDLAGKGRGFFPELCGASALSFISTAVALAGGIEPRRAWLLAVVLALQAITAIAYVGARVRLARGVEVNRIPAIIGHLVALTIIGAAVSVGSVGWLVMAASGALALRAVWGLSCHRCDVRAAIVGVQEVGYALLTVICLAWSAM